MVAAPLVTTEDQSELTPCFPPVPGVDTSRMRCEELNTISHFPQMLKSSFRYLDIKVYLSAESQREDLISDLGLYTLAILKVVSNKQ